MNTYHIERIQGQAGYEKTLWTETIEAETIREVLDNYRPSFAGWTEYSRDDFASLSNPEAGDRYDDSLVIELDDPES